MDLPAPSQLVSGNGPFSCGPCDQLSLLGYRAGVCVHMAAERLPFYRVRLSWNPSTSTFAVRI